VWACVTIISHYDDLDVFGHFVGEVETQLEQIVKTFLINCGHEENSNLFKEFCEEKGMHIHLTIPSTPQ